MTTEQTIRKMQATLIRIKNKEIFFYNIGQYEHLGLVKEKWSKRIDSWGDEVEELDYILTEKAEKYINVVV